MNKLQQGRDIAATADVSSPQDCVVLYSVSYQPTDINKKRAFEYIKNHPSAMMIDHTPCGKQLLALGMETGAENPPEELTKIWRIASERFIKSATGNITAFVENADKRSTFVTVELPLILQNNQITRINGEDKFVFAAQFGVCRNDLFKK